MDESKKLLKEITEAKGIPGFEDDVRVIIRRHLHQVANIETDRLGNIICSKKGTLDTPKLMIACHMDELGFMVKKITPNGFLRVTPLGMWAPQSLLAQKVIVRTMNGDIMGTFGTRAPHIKHWLQLGGPPVVPKKGPHDEWRNVYEWKDMFVDVGCTSEEEVKDLGIRIGDPIFPSFTFTSLANNKTYLSKSWDDRVGCAVMIEIIKRLSKIKHPNTVFGVGTVQEELGAIGVEVAVKVVNPDVAIVIESGVTGDHPGIMNEENNLELGKGPEISHLDWKMVCNKEFIEIAIETAQERKIPLQHTVANTETDAGPIHLHNKGVPTLVLSVPTRYCHSYAGIIHREDYDNIIKLLVSLITKLDTKTVKGMHVT